MMWSKITSRDCSYPIVKKSTTTGVVVLFCAPGKGTVLDGRSLQGDTLGAYSEQWDESFFREFDGEVTVGNE